MPAAARAATPHSAAASRSQPPSGRATRVRTQYIQLINNRNQKIFNNWYVPYSYKRISSAVVIYYLRDSPRRNAKTPFHDKDNVTARGQSSTSVGRHAHAHAMPMSDVGKRRAAGGVT